MRLAKHITALRDWWLIASLVRRKPGVLRPGFVGMRGQWSYDYGMQDYEYNPLFERPPAWLPLLRAA